MLDWGVSRDFDLSLKQALFYERSGFREWRSLEQIAEIDDDEWNNAQLILQLLSYFRWMHKPNDD